MLPSTTPWVWWVDQTPRLGDGHFPEVICCWKWTPFLRCIWTADFAWFHCATVWSHSALVFAVAFFEALHFLHLVHHAGPRQHWERHANLHRIGSKMFKILEETIEDHRIRKSQHLIIGKIIDLENPNIFWMGNTWFPVKMSKKINRSDPTAGCLEHCDRSPVTMQAEF